MYSMYANASNNTPSYTYVSSYMAWRVHPQGSYPLGYGLVYSMGGQYKLRSTWNFHLQIMKYAFWYHQATPFHLQFQLVLVVDVLVEKNKLNW